MRKDHLRDYATEAYRFYAREGGTKKYLEKLTENSKRNPHIGMASSTEGALIKKEDILRDHASEFADLEAAEKALYILETAAGTRGNIKKCVEYVYFKNCWKDLEKGDITERVHYAELHIPASERQIYYWLKKARLVFAEERGLRL
jgi:hypothetical protein